MSHRSRPTIPPTKSSGFSLVELMVVISIMSLLSALALPKVANLKIRAAQAEKQVNLNFLYTALKSHRAENENLVVGYSIQHGTYKLGGDANFCGTNSIGFFITECEKLRYFYNGYAYSGSDEVAASASSVYLVIGGSVVVRYGNKQGPPTSICTKRIIYEVRYNDIWTMDNNRHLTATHNALSDCWI